MQNESVQFGNQAATETTTATASVAATQNKTRKEDSSDAAATTEKIKLSNRKSFSAVKNLPDAEKLRTTTANLPQIPAPIPSKACLISTVNCPSDKNREVVKSPKAGKEDENLLSNIISSYSPLSAGNYFFNNLLAFNKNYLLSSAKVLSKETKSSANSDLSQGRNFFSDFEMYDPSAPASFTASANALMLPPGGNGKIFDFDGDNKADMSFWRPDTGAWFVLRSSDSSYMTQTNFGLGSAGDRIVPGNYDGDTKTDYAYWRPSNGIWTIKQSSNSQLATYTLGQAGDLPVPGDYDGDGKTDVAVWRPSSGTWLYRKSSDGTTQSYNWGLSTDVPVVGDFDGDNKTDFAVVRSSDTHWYMMLSSNGWYQIQWGAVGDRLVPGDYDGDGKTDVGVWRASDNTWYIRKSSTGVLQALTWGIAADYPTPADFDGDGKTDMAIWRNSTGQWWVTQSSNGSQYGVSFGATGDIPIPVSYVAYLSSSNQTPTAEAGGHYTAAVNTAIQLNGRGSTDADGQVYGYNWNFGDGSTGTGSRPAHTYSATGTYTVSLTVTDNRGAVSAADTATVTVIDATSARLDPFNAVGGDNAISRNFSWGTGLAGLPGRAGMGAGIGLSYNSLVWLKQENYMIFDPDNGFPGPGFRLGMPVIEKRHYNSQTGKYYYLMLTESGSRVEFRQVGTSTTYETADSSYTQLIDSGSSLLIRTTDGTQHSYQLIGSQFQCIQIKDSNGNFIAVGYNSSGRLTQITDTLGRALVVNYDEHGNPISVAQSHSGGQRVYATLGYETLTVNASFSGLTVIGPANNSQITVLKQVAFDDGSYYRFNYNSYGQIYQIDSHAADYHKLSHVKYNLESPGTQTDCPRFTMREDYAENWTTTTTSYTAPATTSWTMPDNNQPESGMMSKMTAPDGTESRYYYHSTGWDKTIPMLVETWGADKPGEPLERQRWSTVRLTQNNTGVSYIENPRATSSAVGDAGSVRKSSVSYTTYTLPSLTVMYSPNDSTEYAANGTTIYRHAQTDYELDADDMEYVNRYIIGLVKETRLYDGAGTNSPQARTEFVYDDYTEEPLTNLPGIFGHETSNYGAAFKWRGNLTSAKRWDVVNTTQSTVNKIGYTIAGTPAWTQDPVQTSTNRVSISYTDNFSDGINNRNTYAYPTTVTDPDGFTATSKYHYLSGLVDEVRGPKAGQTNDTVRGAISKTHYDTIDRVQKVETLDYNGVATGAYTRYVYESTMTEVKTYTKLDSSLAEAYTLAVLDGHGRTRATASELPGTSNYSGRTFLYDNMGRNWKSSMPAETGASGNPSGWTTTGDDAAWLYVTESFDWKGRSLVMTNTDSTTKEALYEGCGCAGGQTVVTRDEVGRRQKVTYDFLGRPSKSQVLPIQPKTETLNGSGTSYSTTVDAFNSLNQVTSSKTYEGDATGDGSCPSGTCQEATTEYDGFKRIWRTHAPEQNANSFTTYLYNSDDTLQSKTDARGAVESYTYNFRKLLMLISYNAVANSYSVGNISFQYDAAGNRTQMVDEHGTATYLYDSLSRVQEESRSFTALGNTYTRSYTYNDAGLLTRISAPNNSSLDVTYTYDKAGRLEAINGGGYASNIQYRAWGPLKRVTYQSNVSAAVEYNNRLQPSKYELKKGTSEVLLGQDYRYTTTTTSTDNDGKLKFSHEYYQGLTNNLDRTFVYNDPAARLTNAFSNIFEHTYAYNGRGHQTQFSWKYLRSQWTPNGTVLYPAIISETTSYTNNRVQSQTYSNPDLNASSAQQYDADGRLTQRINTNTQNPSDQQTTNYSYDVAGRLRLVDTPSRDTFEDYDGDGRRIKFTENGAITYSVRSTALGGAVVMTLDSAGNMKTGYVISNGVAVARQENNQSIWLHNDIPGNSSVETNSAGNVSSRVELDPLGNLGSSLNPSYPSPNSNPSGFYGYDTLMNDLRTLGNCSVSGGAGGPIEAPCSMVNNALRSGSAVQCPTGGCGAIPTVDNQGNRQWAFFRYTDNFAGWMTDNQFFGTPQSARTPPVLRPAARQAGSNAAGNRGNSSNQRRGGPNTIFDEETGSISLRGLREFWSNDDFYDSWYQYFMKWYVEPYFDKCNGSNYAIKKPSGEIVAQMGKEQTALSLMAAVGKASAEEVAGIWLRESNWQLTPGGDAGPAQLTSWWKDNQPDLIVGNAYGNWKGSGKDYVFDGNVKHNVATLGKIISFNKGVHGNSFYKAAYWYGPGERKDKNGKVIGGYPRDKYANEAVEGTKFIKPLFDCLRENANK